MTVVLLGGPGAGKGSQAGCILDRYGILQISTSDMLRAAGEAGSPLGLEAKCIMDAGQLVLDELMVNLVCARVAENDCRDGFLVDGLPRTIYQAEALLDVGVVVEAVVGIAVDDVEIVRRMSGRRVHPASARTDHINFDPSCEDGKDDVTGQPLVQREDDAEETVRKRLEVYQSQTAPRIEFH
jgi:adenylate kinase